MGSRGYMIFSHAYNDVSCIHLIGLSCDKRSATQRRRVRLVRIARNLWNDANSTAKWPSGAMRSTKCVFPSTAPPTAPRSRPMKRPICAGLRPQRNPGRRHSHAQCPRPARSRWQCLLPRKIRRHPRPRRAGSRRRPDRHDEGSLQSPNSLPRTSSPKRSDLSLSLDLQPVTPEGSAPMANIIGGSRHIPYSRHRHPHRQKPPAGPVLETVLRRFRCRRTNGSPRKSPTSRSSSTTTTASTSFSTRCRASRSAPRRNIATTTRARGIPTLPPFKGVPELSGHRQSPDRARVRHRDLPGNAGRPRLHDAAETVLARRRRSRGGSGLHQHVSSRCPAPSVASPWGARSARRSRPGTVTRKS